MSRWAPLAATLALVAAMAALTRHLVDDGLVQSRLVLERAGRLRLLSGDVAREAMTQADTTQALLLDPDLIVEVSEAKIAAYDRQKAGMSELAALATDANINALLEQVRDLDERQLKPLDEMLLEQLASGEVEAARATYRTTVVPARERYDALIARLASLADDKAREAEVALTAQTERTGRLLLGLFAGAGLLVIGLFALNRSRRAALDSTSRMQRLVEVTRQLLSTTSSAEVGATLRATLGQGVSLVDEGGRGFELTSGGRTLGSLDPGSPVTQPEELGFWQSLSTTVAQHLAGLAARDELQGCARQIADAERRTRAVLESLSEGLVVIDPARRIQPLWSRAMAELAPLEAGASFERWLFPDDEVKRSYVQSLFEQLVEDVFPFEVSASQFPATYERGERTFAFALSPVRSAAGQLELLIVTLRDVTEEVRLRKASLESRDLFQFLERAREQPDEAGAWLDETSAELAQLDTDLVTLKRRLHTVKGTSAVFGLEAFSGLVHEAESVVEEQGALPDAWRERLSTRYLAFERRARSMLSDTLGGRVSIPREALEPLATLLEQHHETQSAQFVRSLALTSLGARLEALARQAVLTAQKLNKRVEVSVHADDLRVEPQRFTPFLRTLVHVVRNAIDHGLERPEERVAKGKSPTGALRIEAHRARGGTEVCIGDDGAGIDFEKLKQRALERRMPANTHDELVDALFADGVSTRDEVSETSGRGVGLSAVLAECRRLGGQVSVENDHGARFRFWFPDQPTLVVVPPLAVGA